VTSFVLAHPTSQRAQVLAVYDAHDVHRLFAAQEFVACEDAAAAGFGCGSTIDLNSSLLPGGAS